MTYLWLSRTTRKMEREFLEEHVMTRKGGIIPIEIRFRLDIGQKFVTVRVERHCNRLPREAVGCSAPGVVHGQIGQSPEKQGPVQDVLAHGKGV